MAGKNQTPGPWEMVRSYDGICVVGIGHPASQTEVCRFERGSLTRDNARLMVAAPEMRDLLEDCRALLENGDAEAADADQMIARIAALLAKIEGQQ